MKWKLIHKEYFVLESRNASRNESIKWELIEYTEMIE